MEKILQENGNVILARTSDCLKTSPSLLKTHKTYFMILYSLIVSYMYEIHTRTK